MVGQQRQGTNRVWWWLLVGYALIATPGSLSSCRRVLEEVLVAPEMQLFVVSDVRLTRVEAVYHGQKLLRRPTGYSGGESNYVAFAPARPRTPQPNLSVSWEGKSGAGTLTRQLLPLDSHPRCLVVLRLDANGEAVPPWRPDADSPFFRSCSHE